MNCDDGSNHVVSLVGEIHAVVHCCDFPRSEKDTEQDSCLMKCWSLEYQPSEAKGNKKRKRCGEMLEYNPLIREIPISCLNRSIFVVEDYPGVHDSLPANRRCIYHVSEQREWSQEFT